MNIVLNMINEIERMIELFPKQLPDLFIIISKRIIESNLPHIINEELVNKTTFYINIYSVLTLFSIKKLVGFTTYS